jgi:hypothetical protein
LEFPNCLAIIIINSTPDINLVPADNALPMDATLAWTRQDWEREEAGQRWRLLDLAGTQRRARQMSAAHQARGLQR